MNEAERPDETRPEGEDQHKDVVESMQADAGTQPPSGMSDPATAAQPHLKTEFDGGEGSPLKKRKWVLTSISISTSASTWTDCGPVSRRSHSRYALRSFVRCAVFLVYLGNGYQGMQRNPGVKSIEEDLFNAMAKAGAISEKNAECEKSFQKVHWSRSARTDKGVSAICQVVSMMFLAPQGVVSAINEHLPPQIRVLGYHRTVKGFDARKACDRRRYEYIFPEWLFDPSLQPTDKSFVHLSAADFLKRRDPNYVFDDAAVAKMTGILEQYEGTHNFHNYTVRVAADSGQAQRYMLRFTCEGVIEISGERWVKMVVVGQSFMLHQIRKMIGMALAVFRGMAPETALKDALRSRVREGVPMAPDLGLFLDKCFFQAYNRQWGKQYGDIDTDLMYGDTISEFKHSTLYPALAQRDREEQCNAEWIRELYMKRVSYFHRYAGFTKEPWDYVYEEDGPVGGEVGGEGVDEGIDEGSGGGTKRPSNTPADPDKPAKPAKPAKQRTAPVKKKKKMMDISGEYSD